MGQLYITIGQNDPKFVLEGWMRLREYSEVKGDIGKEKGIGKVVYKGLLYRIQQTNFSSFLCT